MLIIQSRLIARALFHSQDLSTMAVSVRDAQWMRDLALCRACLFVVLLLAMGGVMTVGFLTQQNPAFIYKLILTIAGVSCFATMFVSLWALSRLR
jgi:hypothetical protein